MIAITGSTGKLGHHVIQELARQVPPSQIIALARNPANARGIEELGVQVRQADYDDKNSLAGALKGATKVLLISSNEIGKRESQHKNIIAAALANKIQHLVYTSILRANSSTLELAKEHLATEAEIKKSALAYTLLRNGWYLENHTENMSSAIATGTLLGSAGEGRFSSASRLDYALAAVKVLTQSGHENKTYELGGNASFTLNELAKQISDQTKKAVAYRDLPEAEYEKLLVSFGLPQGFAHVLADSDTGAKNSQLFTESTDLEKLIGRKTTSLKEALRKAASK